MKLRAQFQTSSWVVGYILRFGKLRAYIDEYAKMLIMFSAAQLDLRPQRLDVKARKGPSGKYGDGYET